MCYVENVEPQPHIDVALGFSKTNLDPIVSSFQSMLVPNKYKIDCSHVCKRTPESNICVSVLSGFSVHGSNTYSNPLQPPDLQ